MRVAQHHRFSKKPWIVHLQWVNFMVCKLYFNKTGKLLNEFQKCLFVTDWQFATTEEIFKISFPTWSSTLGIVCSFDYSPSGYIMLSYCGFNLNPPSDKQCWLSFQVLFSHSYILFDDMCISSFFNWIVSLLITKL